MLFLLLLFSIAHTHTRANNPKYRGMRVKLFNKRKQKNAYYIALISIINPATTETAMLQKTEKSVVRSIDNPQAQQHPDDAGLVVDVVVVVVVHTFPHKARHR